MVDRREVSTEQGEEFARRHGIHFAEVSAANQHDIEQLFTKSLNDVFQRVQLGFFERPVPAEPTILSDKHAGKPSDGCAC